MTVSQIKAHTRRAHEGLRGIRGTALPLTSALIAGGWSVSYSSCFTPLKDPVPTVQDAGWTPQQISKAVGVYENISEHF
jgi:hypothetical protein